MTMPVGAHPALAAWAALRASGAASGALVTLVRADGGAAKSLGTHLALADDGRIFGSVTVGGCADGRALDAARRVLERGAAEQLSVPLSEEDALALGLGCAGDVDLLVEPVRLDDRDPATRAFDAAVSASAAGTRAVMLALLGEGARGRLLVCADGRVAGGTGDAVRDAAGARMAMALLHDPHAGAAQREAGDGGGTWFAEPLVPLHTLLVVGATEIAAALCTLAQPLGWRTTLLDPRDEVLAQPRFAAATERLACLPAEVVAQRLTRLEGAAVVIVAHDYRVELPVLRAALSSESAYVGMLGSRRRGATIREMLAEDGVAPDRIARLRSPIGLAIGAEGPVEIAVSIVAELVATWRGVAARP